MPKIIFHHDQTTTTLDVAAGTNLLAAARTAGVYVDAPCNGSGACGKCRVEYRQTAVLACQTVVEDDMEIRLTTKAQRDVAVVSSGRGDAVRLAPYLSKRYLPAEDKTLVQAGDVLLVAEPGNTEAELYGLAVDIGTTTLVVSLVDLNSGAELAVGVALNPQCDYVQDVLSRIRFAAGEDGLRKLHEALIAELNRLTDQVAARAGVATASIYEAVFSGNTCMLHLALAVSPASLGKYPYTPAIRGGDSRPAADCGLAVSSVGQVYLPPVVSGYIGADITSGIIAAGLQRLAGTTLFIDIGTNGEMILARDGVLVAASTAAGPALEGMNISCGMRAASGAVERFRVAQSGEAQVGVIGGGVATGICGSGLVDIISELLRMGIIEPSGKFAAGVLRDSRNGKPVYAVSDAVYLTQKDIRQVQLAKAAIRAGVEALLTEQRLRAGEVERVFVAGSFGYHLDADNLIVLGLLPAAFRGKIEFLGNTSKYGAQAFLLDQSLRRTASDLVTAVTVVELANVQGFDKLFVKCMTF